ncbi:14172_t:CDS:2, partial [Dentiscutata erythropus]
MNITQVEHADVMMIEDMTNNIKKDEYTKKELEIEIDHEDYEEASIADAYRDLQYLPQ